MEVKDKEILKSLRNIEKLEKSISMLSSMTLKTAKSASPKIFKMTFKSPVRNQPKAKQFKKKKPKINQEIQSQSYLFIDDRKEKKCCIACQAKNNPPSQPKPHPPLNKSLTRQRSICLIQMDTNTKQPDPSQKIQKYKTILENQLQEINKNLYKSKFKLEAAKSLGSLKTLVKANFQTFKQRYSKLPESSLINEDMSTTCFKNYSFQQ